MRLVGWYYADGKPASLGEGPVTIRVMTGDERSTIRDYHGMYSVDVRSPRSLSGVTIPSDGRSVFLNPTIIVEHLSKDAIDAALSEWIDRIARCGIKID
jgi:hypothetical protein